MSRGSAGPLAVVAGLLALLVGREAVVLDAAHAVRLDRLAQATPESAALAADRDAWAAGGSRRNGLARALVAVGQAVMLAGLAVAAWAGPRADRWLWGALLGWCLVLLFGSGPRLPERLR